MSEPRRGGCHCGAISFEVDAPLERVSVSNDAFRLSTPDTPITIDVNVRCVQDVDLDARPVDHFDGIHWEEAQARAES